MEGHSPELPPEILEEILALLEIPDLVRASSVCSSWNSAYTSLRGSIGHYRRPQTPCLIYTSDSAGENVACLYSLAEKKTYRLTLPEPPIHRRGEQIALPSVITIEQVTPIFDDAGAICEYQYSQHTARWRTGETVMLALDKLRDHLFHKALVFEDSSAGGYLVVLIHSPYGQLSFAWSGDEKWTWLPSHTHVQDCIYKDGLLYAVTVFGEIVAFNLSGTMVTTNIIMDRTRNSHGCERVYIVQAPWGDLLQVRRPEVWVDKELDGNADISIFQNNTVRMEIYKVCTAEKRLVEIKSLDGLVLFLGHNQSLCSRAEDYPQLKPNHVYFTDDARSATSKKRFYCHLVIGVLNYETKSVEEIVFPRPWSNWHSPLLIIPNLSKTLHG
ncbi:hypothetical protein ACP4OV_022529 [Aristida adscensionis]